LAKSPAGTNIPQPEVIVQKNNLREGGIDRFVIPANSPLSSGGFMVALQSFL
jgi:hypothetical protein